MDIDRLPPLGKRLEIHFDPLALLECDLAEFSWLVIASPLFRRQQLEFEITDVRVTRLEEPSHTLETIQYRLLDRKLFSWPEGISRCSMK